MIWIGLIVGGLLLAGIALWVLAKPGTFRLERHIRIQAAPGKIFPWLVDFKNWQAWSPYAAMTPLAQRQYGEISGGRGATYAWSGNAQLGQGSMEMVYAAPSSQIVIKLDLKKPRVAHCLVEFVLQPEGDGTEVTWAVYGKRPRRLNPFWNLDQSIGKNLAAGLSRLKVVAEQ